MEIIGKQGRKVPLLIPPDVKQALELFVSKRNDAGVPADNPFVFAKVSVHCASELTLSVVLFLYVVWSLCSSGAFC